MKNDLHTIFTNLFIDLAPHFAGTIVGLLGALPALIAIAIIIGIMFWVMASTKGERVMRLTDDANSPF